MRILRRDFTCAGAESHDSLDLDVRGDQGGVRPDPHRDAIDQEEEHTRSMAVEALGNKHIRGVAAEIKKLAESQQAVGVIRGPAAAGRDRVRDHFWETPWCSTWDSRRSTD